MNTHTHTCIKIRDSATTTTITISITNINSFIKSVYASNIIHRLHSKEITHLITYTFRLIFINDDFSSRPSSHRLFFFYIFSFFFIHLKLYVGLFVCLFIYCCCFFFSHATNFFFTAFCPPIVCFCLMMILFACSTLSY